MKGKLLANMALLAWFSIIVLAVVIPVGCTPTPPPIPAITIEGFPFALPAILGEPLSAEAKTPIIGESIRLEPWLIEEHYIKKTITLNEGQTIDIIANSDTPIYWMQEHPGYLSLEILPGIEAGPRLVDRNKIRTIYFNVNPWCRLFNDRQGKSIGQTTIFTTAVRLIAWGSGKYDLTFTNYGRIPMTVDYRVYDVGTVADFNLYQTWALQRLKESFP